ncbi:uncharacterized protein LOC119437561 isoform X2 [Dermacentor silvarum]|uniref:uncharacterized protein LOC119437561 isoform X2 n=1 Tax=Dermacentor silvarum TaxID=543639 RepID=UPI002100A3ED|nr:uncharacterized protein LOC119437561 isoform X2 [Dermacentor silvarum]
MSTCSGSYGSYCCVPWCQNNGRTRKKLGTCFFRIPQDGRSTAWMTYSQRVDLMEKPASVLYKSYRMCSEHFTAQDFMDPGHTRLTKTAVPTVYSGAVNVPSVGAFVASFQNPVPEDHLDEAVSITSIYQDPGVQGYGYPANEEQAGEDVLQEACKKGSLMTTSGVAEGDVSKVSPSASSFIDSAASSVGGFPVACSSTARGSPSKKFRTTIQRLQSKVASCRRTITRLQKKQSKLPPSISKALNIIRPCVTEEVFKLLCTHVRLHQRGKGKRFPVWLKKFALHLNFRGPRAYRFLAPIFCLPTQRSLRRWLSNVRMSAGVIPGVIESISASTHAWNVRDRVCTLMFDEIALKKNLSYDAGQDIVHGFVDDGIERSSNMADRAMVVLLAGISKRWVQPVAFTIGHIWTSASIMDKLLFSIIEQLKAVRITVKAVICDQGTSNVSLAQQLGITIEKPFFEVLGERVYFIFDVPHLIKTTRNNIQAHELLIGNEVVNWSHVEHLYKSTHELRLRLAPKLTERHIYQKPFSNMKVSRAVQVLSSSVSIAIMTLVYVNELPSSAIATANFCERMDKLFDALNSSSPKKYSQKLRYAIKKGQNELVKFLREQLLWIASWKFSAKRQPHTIIGWQITIQAVVQLWEDLSENYNFIYLLTRRLQQDPLENMFGHIRQKQGCNTNPNVAQFISGLKHIVIQKAFKLSEQANVEDDKSELLREVLPFSLNRASLVDAVEWIRSDDFPSLEDIAELAADIKSHIIDQSAAYYVAGFLVKVFLTKSVEGCTCQHLLQGDVNCVSGEHQYFTMLKAYHVPNKVFGNLTVPSQRVFAFVQELENNFLVVVEATAHLSSVCNVLYRYLSGVGEMEFCSVECRQRFVKMYCRIRLCWHVRFVNRNLDKVRFHSSVSGVQLEKVKG